MGITVLSNSSSGLCLWLTDTTTRVTMLPTVSNGVLSFRVQGITGTPAFHEFGNKLHIFRQATSAQTVDVVFPRFPHQTHHHVVVGQFTLDSSGTRYDWYGEDPDHFATFAGDTAGPRATWQQENADLATTSPPSGVVLGYVDKENQTSADFLAVRYRRSGVATGQTTTTTFKYLMLGDYEVAHRDPKVLISVKTTPPAAGDC